MNFFFTRRRYVAATDTFSRDLAPDTSYVVLPKDNVNAGFRTTRDDWLTNMRTKMGSNEVLIYVHGFNTSQATMLRNLRKVKAGVRQAGFGGAVIAFSWPNRESGSPSGYLSDRNAAPGFAPSLYLDGIRPIQGMAGDPKVHVLCHSLGSYVFLIGLSGQNVSPKIDQLAFVAADLDQPWFHPGGQGTRAVEAWCRQLTNYYSLKDRILDLSENYIHGDPRIGGDGLPHPTAVNQKDVACADRYLSPDYEGKRTPSYSHSFYFDDAPWLRDLGLTLRGLTPDTRGPAPNPPDHVLVP
ncbi:alpha/beta hydrolase [Rhodobacterales bacterium HKCCE3408]|nr:alpha/beta hydrolase [Rhodobacterales bacterium HKCCE3408]